MLVLRNTSFFQCVRKRARLHMHPKRGRAKRRLKGGSYLCSLVRDFKRTSCRDFQFVCLLGLCCGKQLANTQRSGERGAGCRWITGTKFGPTENRIRLNQEWPCAVAQGKRSVKDES